MDDGRVERTDAVDQPRIAPTTAKQRFGAIDTLRGFALLGILVPNIWAFGWPMMATTDPSIISDAPANQLAHQVTGMAFLGKFMFLFAMLFGSGVVMYARKYDSAADPVGADGVRARKTPLSRGAGLWYLRCGILLCFGLIHAYCFWFGDILTFYAISGLTLVWWVRRLNPKLQFFGGLGLYFFGAGLMVAFSYLGYWSLENGNATQEQLSANPEIEIQGYLGSYWDAFRTRFFTTLLFQLIFTIFFMPALWGLMTMGMGLTRMKILTGERSVGFYAISALVLLAVGVPTTVLMYSFVEHAFPLMPGFMWQALAQPVGVMQALGYAALVLLLAKLDWAKIVTVPLAAVGRMALTNYFMHTLLCTTFFYGYGFGKFASIEFPQLWLVVGSVWTINIVFSLLWLRVFSMGPFEWLWRSLTYRQLVPIVRRPARDSAHSDA
ncbi:MAG: DUF418 domain-containing protein [Phycisphaerales bacterium]|nr:DUF418 domain-containing protein [Phycisphaerales bacterium]